MDERKLVRIFHAARGEPVPEPAADFEARLLRQLRCEPAAPAPGLGDQLSELFPKVAWATVLVIGMCLAGDSLLSAADLPGIVDGAVQVSEQWLIPGGGI